MAEKISIQIGLDGGKEVEQQLADIGATGEKSFDQISKAGEQASEGMAKTGEAAKKASDSVSKLSLETVRLSTAIADNISGIVEHGVAITLAVKRHETFFESLLKLGRGLNTTSRVVSAFTPELGLVGVTFGSTAVAIGATAIAFESLRKAAEAAAGPFAKITEQLTRLSSNTGETFDNLQRGKAAFEQLGISGKDFSEVITKINEQMKDFDVGSKIDESFKKALEAEKALLEAQLQLKSVAVIGDEEPIKQRQRLLEITQQLAVATSDESKVEAAAAAQAKAFANNLKDIIPIVQKIVEGQKGLTFDPLTTAATKVDALTAAMKKAGDAGKTAGQVLVEFIASADRLSAIQVGKQFGLTEDQVDRLQRSGGHLRTIDEIWRQIQSAGVLIPPESEAAFARLRVALDAAAQAKARLDQALASSLPATFAAEFGAQLENLKTQLRNMAATDVEAVNRAFTTLATTNPFTNTISELEAVGRLLTSIGGQATGFSWGEIVATGGLASTRQELEAIGRVITLITGQTTAFTWGELWQTGGLASTRQELEGIGGVLDNLIQKFLRLIGLKGSAAPAPAAAGGGQFARGGLLGGRGSGTSDSNLAWVSRGEYITPARAVAQPGMLALLEALRRSGGNLSRVLDGMGRFALGGMVPRPMPAFAGGGMVGAGRNLGTLTLHMPDGTTVSGLTDERIAEALGRAAVKSAVRSGGRKPSRYS